MKNSLAAKVVFFDVDGTILRKPSLEMRVAMRCLREGRLPIYRLPLFLWRRSLAYLFAADRGRRDKSYWKGHEPAVLESAARKVLEADADTVLIQPVISRLRLHETAGARCWLLTGGLEPCVRPLAEHLNIRNVLATRLVIEEGRCTGRIEGTHPFGEGKRELFLEACRQHRLDPAECAAYADSVHDIPLLEAAGYPVAVCPDRGLRSHAKARDWEILEQAAG